MSKLVFALLALAAVASARITLPCHEKKSACPSIDELAKSSLIQKVRIHRNLHILLSILHSSCVDLNIVKRKNQELAQIFGGRDQEQILAIHLSNLLAANEKDKRGIAQTQIAAIAEGLRLVQVSNVQDVNNHALEELYDLIQSLLTFARNNNPKITDLFAKQLAALKEVLRAREFVRVPPFRGLKLNNNTLLVVRALLKANLSPFSVAKALKNIVVSANYTSLAYYNLINDQTVRSIEIIAQLLPRLSRAQVKIVVQQFVRLNVLIVKKGVRDALPSADAIVEVFKNAKLPKESYSALKRQLDLLHFIDEIEHPATTPSPKTTHPTKTTRPTRRTKPTRPTTVTTQRTTHKAVHTTTRKPVVVTTPLQVADSIPGCNSGERMLCPIDFDNDDYNYADAE